MTRVYPLDAAHPGTPAEARALLGGKAANLGVMARDLGLPVPPGFVITTETCRAYLAAGWPDGLDDEVRRAMATVEGVLGRRFGDPADPLLVSVRSGAAVSMPGMMDTLLDLGLNGEICAGLAAVSGSEAFAHGCHERLDAGFRAIVGTDTPSDPWMQLRLAIKAVFRSWRSSRATAYRAREGIADDLGTAVTVQAMVFGNRGPTSATGVAFTRNPATGEATLYGDVLFGAQGEEVVAGTHRTEPIAVLDERLPEVAAQLRVFAARLERHFADLCDIEFTIEDGRLWMLQVRVGKRSPQAALRIAADMADDPGFPLTREEAVRRVLPLLGDPPRAAAVRSGFAQPLVTGLPASPGMASGPIVTSPEAAAALADQGGAAILVRAETSPDDVHGMARAAGILTSRGGLASHAAVVARGWGIPAVVGADGVVVHDGVVLLAGGRALKAGDVITIDGSSGEVFEGAIGGTSEVVPQARTLLDWATELGIPVGQGTEPDAASVPTTTRKVTAEGCLRAVAIKGFAQLTGLAEAMLATPEEVRPIVDQLAIDGLVRSAAGAFRLTEAGTAHAAALLEADRAAWGHVDAEAALNAFLELDRRVKDAVTAWQVRDPAAQVLNDHTDAEYDRDVLERLAALHADAMTWLRPCAAALPRLADYGIRLGRSLQAARFGDSRFIASPRVDSYHGTWFELHEDLIGLAGRTRADEAAAGRA